MNITRCLVGSLAVALVICAPAVAATGGSAPSLTILTPTLDLGSVVPGQPLISPALLNVTLNAQSSWQLALFREAPVSATSLVRHVRPADAAPTAGDLSVQVGQGQWAPLVAGTLTPLLTGGPTPVSGLPLSFEFMATATLDSAFGQHNVGLHFVLNGQPVTPSVQVSYEVAALIGLATDSRPFQLTAPIDPTRPGTYPFDSRFFTVSGNVPWDLEVGFQGRLTDAKSSRTLADGAIVVLFPTGPPQPLLSGATITIASGPAVGSAGSQVGLNLAVVINGSETAGNYSANLVATAMVDPSVTTSGSRVRISTGGGHPMDHAAGWAVPPGLVSAGAGPMRWLLDGRGEEQLRWR